jgi:hypothetical protein
MNYGNLNKTYCITSTYGIAIDYHYFDNEDQAKRAETKLIKEGFKTEII